MTGTATVMNFEGFSSTTFVDRSSLNSKKYVIQLTSNQTGHPMIDHHGNPIRCNPAIAMNTAEKDNKIYNHISSNRGQAW